MRERWVALVNPYLCDVRQRFGTRNTLSGKVVPNLPNLPNLFLAIARTRAHVCAYVFIIQVWKVGKVRKG